MGKSVPAATRRRIQELHQEAGGDDAEALARMFEDDWIVGDGTARGRLEVILRATEHRWIPSMPTPLDMPGLHDCRGYSDRGFRPEFQDPWACSRDQAGHFLTAVSLALYPERLEGRRLGLRIRDLVGAPKEMPNEEVALRLIIGHEKKPDPRMLEPLVLHKIRWQFASATDEDVAVFRRAQAALGADYHLDLERMKASLAEIQVGEGRGNSVQDLYLSFVGYCLAQWIQGGHFSSRHEIARWIRRNLKGDG